MYIRFHLIFLFFLFPILAYAEEWQENLLLRDLALVDLINQKINDRVPVTYNQFLQGGYINMPSARMGEEGELGFGFTSLPPYRLYNARCQALPFLEITGNYRVFRGIEDSNFGSLGFGEFSDKGVNIKLGVRPEDSNYELPGFALGFDDIFGTRSFHSTYLVATYVFKEASINASIGYGWHRLRGFYAGLEWMPFRDTCKPILEGISFVSEYDATDYRNPRREPHPRGRTIRSHFNFGVKWRLGSYIDLTASVVRGTKFSFAVSTFYNFGQTDGFLPKCDDPLPYCYPINTEPISCIRPEHVMIQDLNFAFSHQGFLFLGGWLTVEDELRILRVKIYNEIYYDQYEMRSRIYKIISSLTPCDIDEMIVEMECEGFSIQEYHFRMEFLREYADRCLQDAALTLLSPMQDVSPIDPCITQELFYRPRDLYSLVLLPRTFAFFGSSKGKFKYALGVNFGINGFILGNIYYDLLIGKNFTSTLGSLGAFDILNPSQLIQVKTGYTPYYQYNGVTVDKAYLQKAWNLGSGLYSRIGGGYFDIVYGGLVFEMLYYPVCSDFAIGFEYAELRKRTIGGLGFVSKIKKLNGIIPSFVPFHGRQFFIDTYYNCRDIQMDFKISVGQFLAKDKGVRFEVGRYFDSGLRLFLWYTLTNAHDVVNGKRYYDKGVGFSMPLDIFFTSTSRQHWGHKISAWQRDCGYRTFVGRRLYDLISEQRN